MRRCSNAIAGSHMVWSDSSDKQYEVTISDTPGIPDTCKCVNYAIQRNKMKAAGDPNPMYQCKHIKRVRSGLAGGCGWDSETGISFGKYPTICPECFAPTVEFDKPTTEDPDDALLAATAANLMKMRETMT